MPAINPWLKDLNSKNPRPSKYWGEPGNAGKNKDVKKEFNKGVKGA
jgi:hypothetical protein